MNFWCCPRPSPSTCPMLQVWTSPTSVPAPPIWTVSRPSRRSSTRTCPGAMGLQPSNTSLPCSRPRAGPELAKLPWALTHTPYRHWRTLVGAHLYGYLNYFKVCQRGWGGASMGGSSVFPCCCSTIGVQSFFASAGLGLVPPIPFCNKKFNWGFLFMCDYPAYMYVCKRGL